MQFDHVRGKKRGDVASMVSKGVSLRTLRMEISKCEIVCANCHSTRTWQRRQEAVKTPEPVDEELRLFE
jgi:hypothetical protein